MGKTWQQKYDDIICGIAFSKSPLLEDIDRFFIDYLMGRGVKDFNDLSGFEKESFRSDFLHVASKVLIDGDRNE